MHVDFWFDFSCPYAYLASREIEAICTRAGVGLRLCPMLLGGVFRAIGAGDGPLASLPAAKAAHNARDMTRWAERRGTTLRFPPGHPMRTVRALRTLLALPEAHWPAAMHGLFAAYWRDAVDLTGADGVAAALAAAGIPADAIAAATAAAETDELKAELRRRTDAAVAAGVFGAPAMVVTRPGAKPVLLWGQDRMHWIAPMAAGWDPDGDRPPDGVGPADPAEPARPDDRVDPPRVVDFWFDYSSPFAYLGSTQIEALTRATGAELRWRPMLLGALFRQVGSPDVPLLAMPEAKRRYIGADLERWARWWRVDYRFNSHFPVRTVSALRLTLLAGDAAAPLVHRLFRAVWVDDLDVADLDVLRRLAGEAGVDPGLVDRLGEPATKQALIASTAAAAAAGVFGAPTTVVHDPGGPLLFWGQDRLDLAAAAAAGWRPEGG